MHEGPMERINQEGLASPHMNANADAYLEKSRIQKEKYWKGVSDRTRTLSLGALVLIWGIFSQKVGESELKFDATSKSYLLGIALCAVVVLALDFFEYLAAYRYRRQQAGEEVRFKRFPYHGVEETMRVLKVALAIFALLALCIVLWHALPTPPHSPRAVDCGQFLGNMVRRL
jgi:hypothetical protein